MIKLSVLDQSPIRSGAGAADAFDDTLRLAKEADRLGFHRYWLAEHHSSHGLAGSAPEILVGHIAANTSHIRVGAGGVMLSHYSPLKVAESFRVLETLHPGRIDLGIGRAPGSDGLTDQALATGPGKLGPQHFPSQLHDLIGYLHDGLPEEHPFRRIHASPKVETAPDLWLLGSSDQSAGMAAYFGQAFSFAHFISGPGGGEIMAAYREHFRPSADHEHPLGSVACFAICADTEEDAGRLMTTRDLWSVRQRRGETAPVPTVEVAEAYEFTPQERALADHNRKRFVWGTPEQVRDRLAAIAAEFDVDEVVVVTICPEIEQRIKSYQLLADAFGLAPRP